MKSKNYNYYINLLTMFIFCGMICTVKLKHYERGFLYYD